MESLEQSPAGAFQARRDASPELTAAHALLRGGRSQEAEALCRAVLMRNPREAAALHLLGLVRKATGDLKDAERLMRESIAIESASAHWRSSITTANGSLSAASSNRLASTSKRRKRSNPVPVSAGATASAALAPAANSPRARPSRSTCSHVQSGGAPSRV